MKKFIITIFIFGFVSLAGTAVADAQMFWRQGQGLGNPCCLSYGWHDSSIAAYGPFFGSGNSWNQPWGWNQWNGPSYSGWGNGMGNTYWGGNNYGNRGFLGANVNFGFGW